MSKNASKIRTCITQLLANTDEIVSGTVVNTNDNGTISVLVTGYEKPIENVRLNAITDNDNGWLIYPELNSHVVIACIDGPGEYTLIRASNISKAVVKIGDQTLTMDGSKYGLVTGSESMGKLMDDLIMAIKTITVTTSTGPSGVPINSKAFDDLKTRIDNFLVN